MLRHRGALHHAKFALDLLKTERELRRQARRAAEGGGAGGGVGGGGGEALPSFRADSAATNESPEVWDTHTHSCYTCLAVDGKHAHRGTMWGVQHRQRSRIEPP